jgi:hypothetical protein
VASTRVTTQTDTSVTPTLTYLGFNGITPYLSVATNIPTAKKASGPSVTQSNGKTDGDLVPTPAFGEGFNIGPTIGANFNLSESFVWGIGIGYTNRGAFDQGTATGLSRFDPGDVTTASVCRSKARHRFHSKRRHIRMDWRFIGPATASCSVPKRVML